MTICLVAADQPLRILIGLLLAATGAALLLVARRPWLVVDEDGVWSLWLGRVLFDEVESLVIYQWMGYRGVEIKLQTNPVREGRKSILGRLSMALRSPFSGPSIVLICNGFAITVDELFEAISRQRQSLEKEGE